MFSGNRGEHGASESSCVVDRMESGG